MVDFSKLLKDVKKKNAANRFAATPVYNESARTLVTPVYNEAARILRTYNIDSPLWDACRKIASEGRDSSDPLHGLRAGTIVRVFPPHDVTEHMIGIARNLFIGKGAHVRIMPRAHSPDVTPVAINSSTIGKTMRQVVEELIASSNTTNRQTLSEVCEAAMSSRGI